MRRKIPVGVSDFRDLIEGDYLYVDKSLFIRDVLDSPANTLLLPRPRRFGKTLNLSLLHNFFETPPVGNATDVDLFAGLAVSRLPECMEHSGRYSVIFLTFKDNKELGFQDCFRKIQSVLADEYRRHRPLIESVLDRSELAGMERLLSKEAGIAETEESLFRLTKYLHRKTGEKVILLVDEYDTPIHSSWSNGYYEEAIHLIRNLLGAALKDNPHIEKGVLTGILRVARESIFSGLNNLAVHTILEKPFSDKFGFTEAETESLLSDFGRASDLDTVREWYNGYLFGDTVIYNPWSILNYCAYSEGPPAEYWINTSSNDLVRELVVNGGPELHGELGVLLNGGTVSSRLDNHIVLRDMLRSREEAFSFLTHCGYLKPVSRTRRDDEDFYELTPPNREVYLFFRSMVSKWLNQTVGDRRLASLLSALTRGEIRTFGKYLQEMVANILSVHDIAGERPERVYHAFVLGLLVNLGGSHTVRSNRESGYGRYDVLLIPKDPAQPGLALEFKKIEEDEGEDVEKALKSALAQIRDKDYASEIRAMGARRILGVGVVFEGKRVFVREAELAG